MTPSNAGDERLEWLIIGLLAKSSTDARWGAFAALSGTPQHPLPVTPKVAKAVTREVESAKAALLQLIAQERTEARVNELEYLISDPPIFGKTLHTDLFGLAPAIDDNWSETKDAGYNNGMREAQNRVKRRIAALRAEGK
jgi:hypothetical protein